MPNFFPEGNTPLPTDSEERSLLKAVSLLETIASGGGGGGGGIGSTSGPTEFLTVNNQSATTQINAANSFLSLSVAAGSFSHNVEIGVPTPSAGDFISLFVDMSSGTQTLTVVTGETELFAFTNTNVASAGLLEFIFSGTAWVASAPNVMFSTSGGGTGGGGTGGGGSGGGGTGLTSALAYWTLDSNAWADVSGNSLTLTDSGSTSVGAGKLGAGSATFSGSTGLRRAFTSAQSTVSVSAWAKGTGSGIILQAGRRDDGGTQRGDYRLIVIGNLVVWQLFNNSDMNVTGVFSNNDTWQHLVGTYDGTTAKLYINGAMVNSMAVSLGGAASTVKDFAIGANFNGSSLTNFATGSTDEVGVWGSALSDSDVTALYNGGTGFNPFA